ncbi:1-acyl-sn-glycerol-3-phosphate acyltransferase [Rhodococcus erythropolis]|uniref:1-acyl-sn-glycerol-3-phosphate acyltransferase n=2 Tax=Rhodococcus erythropolis group TaxID=2840174 RepID=A0A6G9CW81_RHOER|nr:1-acyl-sn-glycerol-3-phosphate acyltransferase [Rhodococcus erythropolis]
MARLALESGVKVIPVAMVGTDKMNPIGSRMWRPAKVTVIVGEPIDFSRFEGMGGNRFVERAVTDEVMYKLMKLSGQEYVDIYAASLKNQAPTKPEAAVDVPAEGGESVVDLVASAESKGSAKSDKDSLPDAQAS